VLLAAIPGLKEGEDERRRGGEEERRGQIICIIVLLACCCISGHVSDKQNRLHMLTSSANKHINSLELLNINRRHDIQEPLLRINRPYDSQSHTLIDALTLPLPTPTSSNLRRGHAKAHNSACQNFRMSNEEGGGCMAMSRCLPVSLRPHILVAELLAVHPAE
jgi:hypothetical protein